MPLFDKFANRNRPATTDGSGGGGLQPIISSGGISALNPGSMELANTDDLTAAGRFDQAPSYLTAAEAEALGEMDTTEKQLLQTTKKGHKHIANIAKTRTSMVKSNLDARAALIKQNEAQYGLYVTYLRQVYNSGVMLHQMNTQIGAIMAAAQEKIQINESGLSAAQSSLQSWGNQIRGGR